MGTQVNRRAAINHESDGMLVAATKRGEMRAFEKLVSRHQSKVFAVVQRITRNREDSEDVMQESFHKAFLHLEGFQERAEFSTWLMRIAMNEAFMLLRRQRRVREVLPKSVDAGADFVSETFVDQSPTPEESCWRKEYSALLTEAITRLSPRIRKTILLCDIEERSVGETARILGASVSAVKSRLSRGRRELGETVNPPSFLTSALWLRPNMLNAEVNLLSDVEDHSAAELQP